METELIMEYRQKIESTQELAKWYDSKYIEMGDGWATPEDECNRHLDALGVPLDKELQLLDVGCGAGHFLAEAVKRVRCAGCEISEVGVELTERRAGVPVVRKSIEDKDWAGVVPFHFVVSIGSLEHIVDIDAALDNISHLVKPETGKFYFYCPNELWQHFDQPNERTMTDEEWINLFKKHGLIVDWYKRWNDNTAFCGKKKSMRNENHTLKGNKLNCGSGQRKFDPAFGWINIDSQARWEPELVADWNDLSLFEDNSIEMVVAHHTIEHVGCGEATGFIREVYRVLKPGCSFLVFVPDMKALAQRWVTGAIDEQIYMTNVYGAYMGDEADRHKWGYSRQGLVDYLKVGMGLQWKDVHAFDWRTIAGADIAKDWWIIGMEAVK